MPTAPSPSPSSWLKENLLTLAGYLTLAGVSLIALNVMPNTADRWIVAVLLLTFGVVMGIWVRGDEEVAWHTHLYLAVQTILVVSASFLGLQWGVFPILFFILSAQAMVALPLRLGLLWIGGFTLVTGAILFSQTEWPQGLVAAVVYTGGYFFFGAFANTLNQAEEARRQSERLLGELREAHQQLQDYAERVEELAVAEERNRLAREMHDTVGHHLTVSAVQLEAAQRLIESDPERTAAMVGTAREEVRQALSELRRTVATLRAPLEADLPLPQALARLAAAFQEATDIAVHLTLPDAPLPLPAAHRLALYRTAQEALTNVQKHAAAGQVWLELRADGGHVTLCVGDDGVSFPAQGQESGFGLRGLRERASQLHGKLRLESRPGGGAQVCMSLPLPEEVPLA